LVATAVVIVDEVRNTDSMATSEKRPSSPRSVATERKLTTTAIKDE
jgi:hypothetical protein